MARYVRRQEPARFGESCRYCHIGEFRATVPFVQEADGRYACPPATCLACGIKTCANHGAISGSCPACSYGLLSGFATNGRRCQMGRRHAPCRQPAVAMELRRFVCRAHLRADVDAERRRATTDGAFGILCLYYVADEDENAPERSTADSQTAPAPEVVSEGDTDDPDTLAGFTDEELRDIITGKLTVSPEAYRRALRQQDAVDSLRYARGR
jgi:hypothetical protein